MRRRAGRGDHARARSEVVGLDGHPSIIAAPTIRPVLALRRRLRRFPWIALTAMLALALIPTLSHELSFARGVPSALSEVCTPQGARLVALNDQAPEPAAFGHLDHCPF